MLRRQVQEDPLGFLAIQFHLLGKFQATEKNQGREAIEGDTQFWPLASMCVCAHTYPHINTHAGTYKNIYN